MKILIAILDRLASLRITVFTLAAALVLVLAGTLAQVKFGLYAVQEQYFQSWFIWCTIPSIDMRIPVYPGGHLIGAVLLTNLIAALIRRFSWTWRKLGIQLIHFGLILMLAGGLATDLFSVSSFMQLSEGESKNYSQDEMNDELALVDLSDDTHQKITVIPTGLLKQGEKIDHPSLPFRMEIKLSYRNSNLQMVGQGEAEALKPAATQGAGARIAVKPLPLQSKMNERNAMSIVVEIFTEKGDSLGTWLVSDTLGVEQTVQVGDKGWGIQLRPARYYKPYSLTLLEFKHETYPGTEIPKNFSSTVMLNDDVNNEHRKVQIYMNHPLRYLGDTYYQSGMQPDSTILQVVRNPSYQAPYLSCVVVSLGLIYQFCIHLFGFIRRTKPIAKS